MPWSGSPGGTASVYNPATVRVLLHSWGVVTGRVSPAVHRRAARTQRLSPVPVVMPEQRADPERVDLSTGEASPSACSHGAGLPSGSRTPAAAVWPDRRFSPASGQAICGSVRSRHRLGSLALRVVFRRVDTSSRLHQVHQTIIETIAMVELKFLASLS
jgi:hypothetical protein